MKQLGATTKQFIFFGLFLNFSLGAKMSGAKLLVIDRHLEIGVVKNSYKRRRYLPQNMIIYRILTFIISENTNFHV